jgi:peroxiredoxin
MKKMLLVAMVLISTITLSAQEQPKGLNVNDKAPDFATVDQSGSKIRLSETYKKGNVVLIFYRGQWCPYCNKQMSELQDSLSMIKDKSATVIAVTAEKPENISKTVAKTKASFSVVHDEKLAIMKQYDVAYPVDAKTVEMYKKYGIDFEQSNGSNGANLPVPAVYIINKEGKIVYRFFNKDYTKRATVKEILSYL